MNTINPVSSVSFNARYVDVQSLDKIPTRIKYAILKSSAVDNFIEAGKPKNYWQWFLDLFKKNEILKISHRIEKGEKQFDSYAHDELATYVKCYDPYAQEEIISFSLKKGKRQIKSGELRAYQRGIRRQTGSIPKPNENSMYKPPQETAEDKLVKQIENLWRLQNLLK